MASQDNLEDHKDKSTAVEQQMDRCLKSLKNPPTFAVHVLEEEKMLRSRIEEQSNLISLLKHRADETLLRYLAMQNINSELNDQVTHLQKELTSKIEHVEALKIRFIDLVTDKDAMEFQKRHNVQIMTENQELRKKLTTLELKLQNEEAQHHSREESLLNELSDAQQHQTDAVKMCEDFKQKLEEVEKQHGLKESNIKKTHAIKEKNTFLKMKKNKTLQEKEEKILRLKVKWREEKKARIEAQRRFKLESEAMNADLKSLQSALDESKAKLKKLSMDFKAFTEHSTNLLEQERNLNKRLRDMIGQI